VFATDEEQATIVADPIRLKRPTGIFLESTSGALDTFPGFSQMPVYNPLSDGGVKRKKLQERNATSFSPAD
jgi:hypothetical protein